MEQSYQIHLGFDLLCQNKLNKRIEVVRLLDIANDTNTLMGIDINTFLQLIKTNSLEKVPNDISDTTAVFWNIEDHDSPLTIPLWGYWHFAIMIQKFCDPLPALFGQDDKSLLTFLVYFDQFSGLEPIQYLEETLVISPAVFQIAFVRSGVAPSGIE